MSSNKNIATQNKKELVPDDSTSSEESLQKKQKKDNPTIMVKVGGTSYTRWKGADLLSEDAIGITKLVKKDEAFEQKLKEVDLSECKVYIMKKVSENNDIPTEADETNPDNWVEVGSHMLQRIFEKESINPTVYGDVFIKVEIPQSAKQLPRVCE